MAVECEAFCFDMDGRGVGENGGLDGCSYDAQLDRNERVEGGAQGMKRGWGYGIHRYDVRLGQYEEMVVIQLLPRDACQERLKYGVQNVCGGDAGGSRHRRRRRRRGGRSRIIMRLPSAQLDLDRASACHARAHEFCRQRGVFVRKKNHFGGWCKTSRRSRQGAKQHNAAVQTRESCYHLPKAASRLIRAAGRRGQGHPAGTTRHDGSLRGNDHRRARLGAAAAE